MKLPGNEIILWIIYFAASCEGPAVSLSINSRPKSSSNTVVPSVFAYRNGSWVLLNDTTVHVSKGGSMEVKKENPSKEVVDELLRKLNLATVQKKALTVDTSKPTATKTPPLEKSLADLFLEWLNKQDDLNKVANKPGFTTSLPVLGLQIDLDDWSKNAMTTFRSSGNTQARRPVRRSPLSRRSLTRKRRYSQRAMKRKILKRRSGVAKQSQKNGGYLSPRKPILWKREVTEPTVVTEESLDKPVMLHSNNYDEKKTDLNELPKYVMRFLSQCKELIEQNDDDQPIDANTSIYDGKGSNFNGDIHIYKENEVPLTEGPGTFFTSLSFNVNNNNNIESSENLNRNQNLDDNNEKALRETRIQEKLTEAANGQINGLDGINIKIPQTVEEIDYPGEKQYDDFSNEWKEGEDYENVDAAENSSSTSSRFANKVTQPKFFESEDANSSCSPLLEQFTPEKVIYTEECPAAGRAGDQTTLNPMQWKALMEFLNERMPTCSSPTCPTTPCPTFPTRPSKTTPSRCTTPTTTPTTTCTTKRTTTPSRCTTTKCTTRTTCRQTCPTTCKTTTTPTTTTTKKCTTTTKCPTTTTPTTTKCTTTCPTTKTTCPTTTTTCSTTTCPTTTTTCPTTTTTCPTTTTTCPTTTTTCPTTTTTCPTTTTTCSTTLCPKPTTTSPSTSTCATPSLDYLMDLGAVDSGSTGDENKSPDLKSGKSLQDSRAPLRYSILFDQARPNLLQDHLQTQQLQMPQIKPKNSNWFDNIRSLKLLEGLRSSSTTNTMRAVYFDMRPYKTNNLQAHHSANEEVDDPDHTEKMIAEGVIPLKTGSTLNLYISYVLNRTKAQKQRGQLLTNNPTLQDKKALQ